MFNVIIYTDGACSGNPGPGGWGAILKAIRAGQIVSTKEIFGGASETTNNRMELTAAISGLKLLKRQTDVTIVTDSIYVKDGMTKWLRKWVINDWKNSENKAVKNKDLWQEIDNLSKKHQITWEWVRGHNDHPENERADYLARQGMSKFKK